MKPLPTVKRFLLVLGTVCAALWFLWDFGGPKPVRAQATVALAPVPRQRFLDGTGLVLTNGCLYTYGAGGTSFLATYSDASGQTVNPDPIQLAQVSYL